MNAIRHDISRFRQNKEALRCRAAARLSLRLLCGEDLETVLGSGEPERRRVAGKLIRRLEGERLRGLRGHWSYDLNRHIGLRQALDLISGAPTMASAKIS